MTTKRLVFCFDGTWNRLDANTPTNVVLTAESIIPTGKAGTAQLIWYDQGVGTTALVRRVHRLHAGARSACRPRAREVSGREVP